MKKKTKRILITLGEFGVIILLLISLFFLYKIYRFYSEKNAENQKYAILESYLNVKNYPGIMEKVTYMEYEDGLQKYSEVANAYEYYNYIKSSIDNLNALESTYYEDLENALESCVMWFYYLQKATIEKMNDDSSLGNEEYLEDIYNRTLELITSNFEITEDELKKRCE